MKSTPARSSTALVLLAVTTLVGCILLDGMRPGEQVFAFDHSKHVGDLDCSDCHVFVEDEEEPGIPVKSQCMLCHADMEEEAPPDRKISLLFDEDESFRRTERARLSDEVRFSHLAHATGDMECGACHTGIETNRNVATLPEPSMDACMACHEEVGVPDDCATCHTEIDRDWMPPGHERAWMQRHGQVFRQGSSAVVDDCSVCHREDTCNACHQEVPPDSHTNFWRRRGHLVEARMDRQSCAVCHREDFCNRCHAETLPISHTGTFGGTLSTHCLTCHMPLASQGCITCHKDTPSHLEATPLPSSPPHSPALNCRQCHGVDVRLPHVDNGDECILCHR